MEDELPDDIIELPDSSTAPQKTSPRNIELPDDIIEMPDSSTSLSCTTTGCMESGVPGTDSYDLAAADAPTGPLLMVGVCTEPVPGQTKQMASAAIMLALEQAAVGVQVLHPRGQRGEWLHKCFIATQLRLGSRSWRFFKKSHAADIELDKQHEWVRLKPIESLQP